MNKQKLISALQSRISKRRYLLSSSWEIFKELTPRESIYWKERLLAVSLDQKQDKAILRQLILDERELKWLHATVDNFLREASEDSWVRVKER